MTVTATRLIDKIRDRESDINSLVYLDTAAAEQLHDSSDGGLQPVVIKDNIAVRSAPWACGSATRMAHAATRDAPVVGAIRRAGGIVIGTSNMDEFAMGASTDTSAWGPTHNPWDLLRTAGGSSGGSAAAVAAYGVLAVGTDTGGSIREPASQCGVVGVKPTYGTIDATDVVPFAPTMDSVGPLAPDVGGAAWLHDAMTGAGSTMGDAARAGADAQRIDMTIGVITEMSGENNAVEVTRRLDDTVDALTALGARVIPVSLPSSVVALNTYFVLSSVEAIPVLEEHARLGELGAEAQYRLDQGRALADTPVWQDALLDRERISEELNQAFRHCDVMLNPTMPLVAPLLRRPDLNDPLLKPRTDWWTVEANLAGIPAISLPVGLGDDSRLPVGMQLSAPVHDDDHLYYVAAALTSHPSGTYSR